MSPWCRVQDHESVAQCQVNDKSEVLELLLHQQWQDEGLTWFCHSFLNSIGAWNGKLNLRVERSIQTFVFVVIEIEFET